MHDEPEIVDVDVQAVTSRVEQCPDTCAFAQMVPACDVEGLAVRSDVQANARAGRSTRRQLRLRSLPHSTKSANVRQRQIIAK